MSESVENMSLNPGAGNAAGTAAAPVANPTQPDASPPMGEFRIGRVISQSFSVLFRNFIPFITLALIIISPKLIYALLQGSGAFSGYSEQDLSIMSGGIEVLGFFLGLLLSAALVFGTYQDLRGRPASIGEILRRGLPMVLPVIGVAIVQMLAGILGFILLIIPGFIVMTMYMVAVPAAVVERKGVLASLSRSAALTKGSRWRVFGAFVVMFLINVLVLLAFTTVLGISFPPPGTSL
ncbi:MAG: hypothetical protein HQ483_15315 [Rhodospirillales bacterium]|nr:hypothetical protein [Rhodospirillales bacterium]